MDQERQQRWAAADFRTQKCKVEIVLSIVRPEDGSEWTPHALRDVPAHPSLLPSSDEARRVLDGTMEFTYGRGLADCHIMGKVMDAVLWRLGDEAALAKQRRLWWWQMVYRQHRRGQDVIGKIRVGFGLLSAGEAYELLCRSRPVLVPVGLAADLLGVQDQDVHEIVNAGELRAEIGISAIRRVLYAELDNDMAASETAKWLAEAILVPGECLTAVHCDDLLRLLRPSDHHSYELSGLEDHRYHRAVLCFRTRRISAWPDEILEGDL